MDSRLRGNDTSFFLNLMRMRLAFNPPLQQTLRSGAAFCVRSDERLPTKNKVVQLSSRGALAPRGDLQLIQKEGDCFIRDRQNALSFAMTHHCVLSDFTAHPLSGTRDDNIVRCCHPDVYWTWKSTPLINLNLDDEPVYFTLDTVVVF